MYRISLTLVKKESLQDGSASAQRRIENPKVGAYRREGSSEIQRSCLLEELQEVDDESDDFSSHNNMRNFRTFSTGQLELGRLKLSRKVHHLHKDLKETATSPVTGDGKGTSENISPQSQNAHDGVSGPQEGSDTDRTRGDPRAERDPTTQAPAANGENGGVHKKKRLLKAKSTEERTSEGPPAHGDGDGDAGPPKSNGKAAKAAPAAPSPETPPKRHPSLLRRSFSFRHWTGGELLRIRALSRDKHHSSSGCIGRDEAARGGGGADEPAAATVLRNPSYGESDPPERKRNTLEVGAVLNRADPALEEAGRRERARGKNRTLDNSDLLQLSEKSVAEKEGFLRGAGGRSSGQIGRASCRERV